MRLNQKEAFYKEIIAALWGYSSDKLSISISELTKDRIEEILLEKGIENYTIIKLLEVIDKCEFAHFAPTNAETELTYIYKEAVEIIEDLEQKIKK